MEAVAHRSDDFELDGTGGNAAWSIAPWLPILPIKGAAKHRTQCKILYSSKGMYCLFDCDDHLLMSSGLVDHQDLWTEDVVEAFFWPDETQHVYFEYELSPLNAELPLLVPNNQGTFMGWTPWHYTGDRAARHATSIRGGTNSPGASITGWSAEFFVPFTLLSGLRNVPPLPGTRWRANFNRIDYDQNQQTLFSWSTSVSNTFHDFERFGTIVFV